jgi:hypothetical protein
VSATVCRFFFPFLFSHFRHRGLHTATPNEPDTRTCTRAPLTQPTLLPCHTPGLGRGVLFFSSFHFLVFLFSCDNKTDLDVEPGCWKAETIFEPEPNPDERRNLRLKNGCYRCCCCCCYCYCHYCLCTTTTPSPRLRSIVHTTCRRTHCDIDHSETPFRLIGAAIAPSGWDVRYSASAQTPSIASV